MSARNPIDYALLDRILSNTDFTKMDCMGAVRKVYEITALTYKTQWLEEVAESDRLTELVVKKNMEIDRLHGKISTLINILEGAGIELPKEYKSIREQISEKIKEETRQ
jgi:hypothetical protein